MPRTLCIAGAALALLFTAGCGGGSSSGGSAESQVDHAFHAYLNGLADQDGAAACAQMSKSLQAQMIKAMEAAGAGAVTKGRDCGEVLDFVAKNVPTYAQTVALLKNAKTSNIKVNGDKATYDWSVDVKGQTVKSHGAAAKNGDTWLITCCVPGQ